MEVIIFKILDLLLAKCWQKEPEDAQAYLRRHYDPVGKRITEAVVRQAVPQTSRAIRQAQSDQKPRDRRKYTRDEKYALTESRLIGIMKAKPAEVSAAYATVRALAEFA